MEDPHTHAPMVRDDFLIANVINCRPPDNILTKAPYEGGAIDHCRQYLDETISQHQPRAIVAMGNQPLRWFTGHWGVETLRGYKFDFDSRDGQRIPVIPTYHPSYIQYGNWEVIRVWQLDVLKALALARGECFDKPKFYLTHPTPGVFDAWVREYFERLASHGVGSGSAGNSSDDAVEPLLLSFDIETPYIKRAGGDKDEKWNRVIEDDGSWMILRISFSYAPFKSISVPWTRAYLPGIQALLASTGDKLVWNRHFDVPRVAKNGCPANGRIIDGMELWHYLEPSLPMGLKYVGTFYCPDMQPWKLMSHSEPEWYNAADADVALRTTLAMIQRVKAEGRWELFLRHVVELGLVLDDLTITGIAVDQERRAEERAAIEALLLEEEQKLQPLIPEAVLPRKVYKSPEAKLRKDGIWVDGRMRLVVEELTEKEKLAWIKKQALLRKREEKAAAVAARKAAAVEKRARVAAEKAAKKLLPRSKRPRSTGLTQHVVNPGTPASIKGITE